MVIINDIVPAYKQQIEYTSHFVPSFDILCTIFIFEENYFGNFVSSFYTFVPNSFRTQRHFVPILVKLCSGTHVIS